MVDKSLSVGTRGYGRQESLYHHQRSQYTGIFLSSPEEMVDKNLSIITRGDEEMVDKNLSVVTEEMVVKSLSIITRGDGGQESLCRYQRRCRRDGRQESLCRHQRSHKTRMSLSSPEEMVDRNLSVFTRGDEEMVDRNFSVFTRGDVRQESLRRHQRRRYSRVSLSSPVEMVDKNLSIITRGASRQESLCRHQSFAKVPPYLALSVDKLYFLFRAPYGLPKINHIPYSKVQIPQFYSSEENKQSFGATEVDILFHTFSKVVIYRRYTPTSLVITGVYDILEAGVISVTNQPGDWARQIIRSCHAWFYHLR
ncbi:hypothetical protein RRG08_034898 [Elysia crispata]|uniref:Uncharacterized protein n=1 Tax=Elysia crispata TaxID=231223 RepID=A0AAE1ALE2_9GAST|nr:hypothetical protein RRG08_034898 [Elysia crispata]